MGCQQSQVCPQFSLQDIKKNVNSIKLYKKANDYMIIENAKCVQKFLNYIVTNNQNQYMNMNSSSRNSSSRNSSSRNSSNRNQSSSSNRNSSSRNSSNRNQSVYNGPSCEPKFTKTMIFKHWIDHEDFFLNEVDNANELIEIIPIEYTTIQKISYAENDWYGMELLINETKVYVTFSSRISDIKTKFETENESIKQDLINNLYNNIMDILFIFHCQKIHHTYINIDNIVFCEDTQRFTFDKFSNKKKTKKLVNAITSCIIDKNNFCDLAMKKFKKYNNTFLKKISIDPFDVLRNNDYFDLGISLLKISNDFKVTLNNDDVKLIALSSWTLFPLFRISQQKTCFLDLCKFLINTNKHGYLKIIKLRKDTDINLSLSDLFQYISINQNKLYFYASSLEPYQLMKLSKSSYNSNISLVKSFMPPDKFISISMNPDKFISDTHFFDSKINGVRYLYISDMKFDFDFDEVLILNPDENEKYNIVLGNLLPQNGGSIKFKKTDTIIHIKNRDRCIHLGPRNKKYVRYKNEFVSLSDLKKNDFNIIQWYIFRNGKRNRCRHSIRAQISIKDNIKINNK